MYRSSAECKQYMEIVKISLYKAEAEVSTIENSDAEHGEGALAGQQCTDA